MLNAVFRYLSVSVVLWWSI